VLSFLESVDSRQLENLIASCGKDKTVKISVFTEGTGEQRASIKTYADLQLMH